MPPSVSQGGSDGIERKPQRQCQVLLGSAKDLSATRRSAPDTDWQPSLACTRAVQQSSIGRKASAAFRPLSPPVFCRRSGRVRRPPPQGWNERSEEHTSELQSLMRISYAVFCLKKKNIIHALIPDS